MHARSPFAVLVPPASGRSPALAFASLAFVTAATASAQWSVVNLHPPGAAGSRLFGVCDQQQVGEVAGNAALWSGSVGSHVDLGPGIALATDGSRQVGFRRAPGDRATMWSGSASAFVDLTPIGWSHRSVATGIEGGFQSGYLIDPSFNVRAAYWAGTAASHVDLTTSLPDTADSATGTSAGQQSGSSGLHAVVWNGSAGSLVDLHPAGAFESHAAGVHAGSQVGTTNMTSTGARRASLWSSTAASWIDLTPPGASAAFASAVHGSLQVGAAFTTNHHATLWIGSAASAIDLHVFLPAGYIASEASGVWTSAGGTTYVSGWATSTTLRTEAMLWIGTVLAPTSFCAGDGGGSPCPCGNESTPGSGVGCLHSLGRGGRLSGRGSASIGADTLQLIGNGMPDASVVYFQGSSSIASGAGLPIGDGLRCAGGTVIRLARATNVSGRSLYPDAGESPISVRGSNSAGDVRTYQAWFRNAAAYCTSATFNTTNGVAVTWQP